MSTYVVWFVVSLVLVVVELMTGTFYVLMIALAVAAGGVVAWLGGGVAVQCVIAGLVGLVATMLLRRSRYGKFAERSDAATDPMQTLDIGQSVQVVIWKNGKARVHHRGSEWDAVMLDGEPETTGSLYIRAVRGTVLTLSVNKP